jgi:hypothetical protein
MRKTLSKRDGRMSQVSFEASPLTDGLSANWPWIVLIRRSNKVGVPISLVFCNRTRDQFRPMFFLVIVIAADSCSIVPTKVEY